MREAYIKLALSTKKRIEEIEQKYRTHADTIAKAHEALNAITAERDETALSLSLVLSAMSPEETEEYLKRMKEIR